MLFRWNIVIFIKHIILNRLHNSQIWKYDFCHELLSRIQLEYRDFSWFVNELINDIYDSTASANLSHPSYLFDVLSLFSIRYFLHFTIVLIDFSTELKMIGKGRVWIDRSFRGNKDWIKKLRPKLLQKFQLPFIYASKWISH